MAICQVQHLKVVLLCYSLDYSLLEYETRFSKDPATGALYHLIK